jgi:hypothetical protein
MCLGKILRCCRWLAPACCLVLLAFSRAIAQGTPRFRQAKASGGELKLVEEVPVLILQGTPDQMGQQAAVLTGKTVQPLLAVPLLMRLASGRNSPSAKVFRGMLERCPDDHRRELESFVQQAKMTGMGRNLLVRLNMLFDTYGALGCSSLIVEGSRSATKAPLFGRNLDIAHRGVLNGYSLIVVYRPEGRHAFASVGFPGLFGVFSGMNERGLALAVHGVFVAPDGSPAFNPHGTPCGFVCREVLETCKTVSEAEKVLRSTKPVTSLNVVLCDRQRGAVAEITPRSFALRPAAHSICACTNHFRSIGAERGGVYCHRYNSLLGSWRRGTMGVAEIAAELHKVNQGSMTLQTMVFEPKPLRLHVSTGSIPASARRLEQIDLSKLLADSVGP